MTHPLEQLTQPGRSMAMELLCLLSVQRTPSAMVCHDLRIEPKALPILIGELKDMGIAIRENWVDGMITSLTISRESWARSIELGDAYAERFPFPIYPAGSVAWSDDQSIMADSKEDDSAGAAAGQVVGTVHDGIRVHPGRGCTAESLRKEDDED